MTAQEQARVDVILGIILETCDVHGAASPLSIAKRIIAADPATAQLAAIDATLARRPAIADAPNRWTAIERACHEAGKVAALETQLAAATAEIERLKFEKDNRIDQVKHLLHLVEAAQGEIERLQTTLTEEIEAADIRIQQLNEAKEALRKISCGHHLISARIAHDTLKRLEASDAARGPARTQPIDETNPNQ